MRPLVGLLLLTSMTLSLSAEPGTPVAQKLPRPRITKTELLLLMAGLGAAEADAKASRNLWARDPYAYERNPIERPFAKTPAIYATTTVDVLVPWVIACKARNRKVRVAAWIFFGAAIAAHAYSAVHADNIHPIRASYPSNPYWVVHQ